MASKYWSLALSIVTVATAIVASYAVFFRPEVTQGDPALDDSALAAMSPTPSPSIPEGWDIEGARKRVVAQGPTVASALHAVESGDVQALIDLMATEVVECAGPESRGSRPLCSAVGVPQGTKVIGVPVDIGGKVVLGSESAVQQQLSSWFARGLELSLVAELPSRELFFAFLDSDDLGGWLAVVIDSSRQRVAYIRFGVATYTPFELFRDAERGGQTPAAIWGASPRQLEAERRRHAAFEAKPSNP